MKIKTLHSPSLLLVLLTLLSGAFLSSCDKDAGVIERKFAIAKIDRSIPTDLDIVEFSVVNEDLCFALGKGSNEIKIFKTTNGGESWVEINKPSALVQLWEVNAQSIVFFDENHGAVSVNSRAYRTYDGGQTWTVVGTADYTGNNYVNDFCFVGKSESGEMIFAESNGSSWDHNHIVTSPPDSPDYTIVHHYSHSGIRPDYCAYSNGRLHYLARNFNFWDEQIFIYDFNTGTMDTLEIFGDIPLDIHYANSKTIIVTELGKIYFKGWHSNDWNVSQYNHHSEDYHAIELIDDYYVAVAKNSISSNFNGVWEEVINLDGTGHSESFRQVQKIDSKSAYVSGDDGAFFKIIFE